MTTTVLAEPTSSARPHQQSVPAQLVRFVGIGVLTWGVGTLVYLALRVLLPPIPANVVSAVLGTALGTELNGRLTFRAGAHQARARTQDVVAALVTVFSGTALLSVLGTVAPSAGPVTESVALAVLGAVTGLIRFAVLRWWVFAPRREALSSSPSWRSSRSRSPAVPTFSRTMPKRPSVRGRPSGQVALSPARDGDGRRSVQLMRVS